MGIFVFFITDRNGDGIRITDAYDSDVFVASEIPSVKLYNDVVCIS
jgi:hypothetical protein